MMNLCFDLRRLRKKMSRGITYISRRSERRMMLITLLFVGVVALHQVVTKHTKSVNLDGTEQESLRHVVNKKVIVLDRLDENDSIEEVVTLAARVPDTPEASPTQHPAAEAEDIKEVPAPVSVNSGALLAALSAKATQQKLVIVPAVIDKGYLDLAINFYVSVIQRLNLQKHTLFMCVHFESCEEAKQQGIPTFYYNTSVSETVGDFNTKEFVQKAMVKHKIVRDILALDFSSLMCDLDMHWFKSPVEEVQKLCGPSCDFAIQLEADIGLNSGFIYVRATNGSKTFYNDLVAEIPTTEKDDQALYNTFTRIYAKKKIINFVQFPQERYPDGQTYWTVGGRTVPPGPPCPECLVVHNNWIVSTEAKVYRFREHMMWNYDHEGYYSDPNRKYITYTNALPTRFWYKQGAGPPSEEYLALKSALGIAIATNRILILPPAFHVWEALSTLQGVILLRHFDRVFKGYYRESTFLLNKLVPKSIKSSGCRGFRIENDFINSKPAIINQTARVIFKPADPENGCTSSEIKRWLSAYDEKCKVVEFESLYRAFKGFQQKEVNDAFEKNIETAFEHGFYDQSRVLRIPPPADPLPYS